MQMRHLESQPHQFTKNGVQYVMNISYPSTKDVLAATTRCQGGESNGKKL